MTVVTFQPRFHEPVRLGTKPHTIRAERKRPIKPGDKLSLRGWSGSPYRSPQFVLRETECVSVTPIQIFPFEIHLFTATHWQPLGRSVCDDMAKADGFPGGFPEMLDWFENVHGLPFTGVLIRWAP